MEEQEEIKDEKKFEEREIEELFEIVKLVRPGTKLRASLDDIAGAGLGTIIVLGDSPKVLGIINGGIKVDTRFTQQKLVELSKLDGAIILSDDLKKIMYCNVLLVPDHHIETEETGSRHMAAERTAKQTSRPVVAISHKRKTITLYYKNMKYRLRDTKEILSKTTETLRILERHREILNELLANLDILEFTNLENLADVVSCIQRMAIILNIAGTMDKDLIELGTEGNIVKILLREIIKGIDEKLELIVKDYSKNEEFTKTVLPFLSLDELSNVENISRALLYSSLSDSVQSRGNRILSKIAISEDSKNILRKNFKSFRELIVAIKENPDMITKMIGDKDSGKLIRELTKLKEQALLGKII